MTPHLTHEQLCDIVLATSPHPLSSESIALQNHLRACAACAAELTDLQASLALFRDTAISYADREYMRSSAQHASILPSHRHLSRPALWAAAAAVFVAAILPFSLHRQRQSSLPSTPTSASAPHTAESDEALLEDINEELSAPVPSPMQPLADPTAGANTATQTTTSDQENN